MTSAEVALIKKDSLLTTRERLILTALEAAQRQHDVDVVAIRNLRYAYEAVQAQLAEAHAVLLELGHHRADCSALKPPRFAPCDCPLRIMEMT